MYLRVREAAIANPESMSGRWMRSNCGRRLKRYADKIELSSELERKVVARVEAKRAAKQLGGRRGSGRSLILSGDENPAAVISVTH